MVAMECSDHILVILSECCAGNFEYSYLTCMLDWEIQCSGSYVADRKGSSENACKPPLLDGQPQLDPGDATKQQHKLLGKKSSLNLESHDTGSDDLWECNPVRLFFLGIAMDKTSSQKNTAGAKI